MANIKVFFNEWCQKNNVAPSFDFRPTGKKMKYVVKTIFAI